MTCLHQSCAGRFEPAQDEFGVLDAGTVIGSGAGIGRTQQGIDDRVWIDAPRGASGGYQPAITDDVQQPAPIAGGRGGDKFVNGTQRMQSLKALGATEKGGQSITPHGRIFKSFVGDEHGESRVHSIDDRAGIARHGHTCIVRKVGIVVAGLTTDARRPAATHVGKYAG